MLDARTRRYVTVDGSSGQYATVCRNGRWLCWIVFFFSSRRRHTRCSRDWSSDVCSSDLWILVHDSPYVAVTDERGAFRITDVPPGTYKVTMWHAGFRPKGADKDGRPVYDERSEERRVGKECRSRWSPYH